MRRPRCICILRAPNVLRQAHVAEAPNALHHCDATSSCASRQVRQTKRRLPAGQASSHSRNLFAFRVLREKSRWRGQVALTLCRFLIGTPRHQNTSPPRFVYTVFRISSVHVCAQQTSVRRVRCVHVVLAHLTRFVDMRR